MPPAPPTPAHDRAVATLHRAGWTIPMIAALTGRSTSAVYRALRREGIGRAPV